MPIPGLDNHVYPIGHESKGQALYFEYGQWRTQTIRAELHELQHADMGRKYAEVDRRSLDPPPVVALRLYQLVQTGPYNFQEIEMINYEDIETTGLLCTAELIPVNEMRSGHHYDLHTDGSYEYNSDHHMSTNSDYLPSFAQHDPVPESEVARLTTKVLIGSKVVQPHIVNHNGRQKMLFVFSDLAVRNLGLFRLRYKFFDLFSAAPGRHTKIQAECIGGTFRIFSTKHFPGLQVSTDLTKILSAHGISLNIRNSERRSKKRKNGRGRHQIEEERQ
ncbi:velvet factor-domain-containing protein [Lentinula aff. detonsa]|uniref:Velvet factor-domain-containing protein n=1 Tax=Lentinula aff. detonsa TaxID=2804958 RepID=A0AA38NRL5_9AGAR|nr:velvet factor-domain-containing protein [Lentinula aff. detonsa]